MEATKTATQSDCFSESAVAPQSLPAVSVIVSVADELDYVQTFHKKLLLWMQERQPSAEVIYVLNGSFPAVRRELESFVASDRRVKVIRFRSSFGEAAVLDAALELAQSERILYLTCRVRIDPDDVIRLSEKLESGPDMVVGVRTGRQDSRLNQWVSHLFNWIAGRITHLQLQDINSGVFVVRRQVLSSVPFYGNLNIFLPVMAQRQGFRIGEEPVAQLKGKFRTSFNPGDYMRRALDLISVVFLRNYTKKPLHFLGFLGLMFMAIGAAIDIYLFFYRLLGFGGIAGKPLLLLGTILFIIGIQMISIGLLGEIIIYTHAREIQDYNIEEIVESSCD
ncbi:glycosyltransferase [candidate division KSB1 bacterium]|nr:glycosyltransferase [candidate division KSB1 bacterium]